MNVYSMCKYVIYTISSIASLIDLYIIRAYSSIIIWVQVLSILQQLHDFPAWYQIWWDFNFINSPWLRAEASLDTTLIMRHWKGCRICILKHGRKGLENNWTEGFMIWSDLTNLTVAMGPSFQHFLKISGRLVFPDHVEMVLEWLQSGGHRSCDTDFTC